jgi:hypothetical protein
VANSFGSHWNVTEISCKPNARSSSTTLQAVKWESPKHWKVYRLQSRSGTLYGGPAQLAALQAAGLGAYGLSPAPRSEPRPPLLSVTPIPLI